MILPYPRRGQEWRVNHSKIRNFTCFRTVFKVRSSNFSDRSKIFWSRSWRGWQFYGTLKGLRNKGLITQKTLFQHAFTQFSRYRVETLRVRQRLSGKGRGGADYSTVPRRGQEWRVNHSKIRNLTCFCTVFKVQSSNFSDRSKTFWSRSGRGWRFYGTSKGSEIKG